MRLRIPSWPSLLYCYCNLNKKIKNYILNLVNFSKLEGIPSWIWLLFFGAMFQLFGLFWMVTGLPIFRPLPGTSGQCNFEFWQCHGKNPSLSHFLKFVFILLDIGPAPRNFLLDPLNFCRTYIFYCYCNLNKKN
jgi:hypothetical protein